MSDKTSDKTSDKRLLPCPFCGEKTIYEISREDYLGTVIPQLFCNSCKMIFEVENDSPYLNEEKTHAYLKEKLYRQFNTRKPMQEIVERFEEECKAYRNSDWLLRDKAIKVGTMITAMDIVKEVGGMNEM